MFKPDSRKVDFSDFSADEIRARRARGQAGPICVRQSFHLYMMGELKEKKDLLAAYLKKRATDKPKKCSKCKDGRIGASRGLGPDFQAVGWLCDTCGAEEIDSSAEKLVPARRNEEYRAGAFGG